MFDERTTTQVAAYFLQKAGGKMNYMKLIKLIYLVDRLSYKECSKPITGDQAYSLMHGPILSNTLDLIKGKKESVYWSECISPPENYFVALCHEERECFLPENIVEMSDKIFDAFGHFSPHDLVLYTHRLPEWKDPGYSRYTITPTEILTALGKTPREINNLLRETEDMKDTMEDMEAALVTEGLESQDFSAIGVF